MGQQHMGQNRRKMTRCTPCHKTAFSSPDAQVACTSGGGPKSTKCACVGGSVHLAEKEIINLSFSGSYTTCTPPPPTCASGGNLGDLAADRATRCTPPPTRTSGEVARIDSTILPPTPDAALDALIVSAVANAESLLGVVAWPDEPDVRIVQTTASGIYGLCTGSGHALAAAHGLPGCAVMVAALRIQTRYRAVAMEIIADEDRHLARTAAGSVLLASRVNAIADRLVASRVAFTAAHELAHALAAAVDQRPDDKESTRLRALPTTHEPDLDPEFTARSHGARWAALAAIIYRRVIELRPALAKEWHRWAVLEFESYGMTFAPVAERVASISDSMPLRRLARDRQFIASVESLVPTQSHRADLIARRRSSDQLPQDVPAVADVSLA